MKNNQHIKNVILDLGGVLFDIDTNKTLDIFSSIIPDAKQNWGSLVPLLFSMEVGGMTDQEFYDKVRSLAQRDIDDSFIKEAWNKMIIDFPAQRIDLIKELKQHYNLYVLSNTNTLHIEFFEALFLNKFNFEFKSMFDHVFYSSDIKLRKPNTEAFKYVLRQTNSKAEETIMVDDRCDNCAGAENAGMKAIQVPENTGLEAVMDELIAMYLKK